MNPRAICYAGLPGAGKSEAARIGQDVLGGTRDSMGQAMRRAFQSEADRDVTSESLGEFATNFRKNHGADGLAERMIMEWGYGEKPERPVHIDGLRCVEEIRKFEDFFGEIAVIFVDASEGVRLSRLRGRDRDGEGAFQMIDLRKRDAREYEIGRAHV